MSVICKLSQSGLRSDYSAHSNFTELSLIELGERGVFPHVGRQTQINLPGSRHPVFPIITGTFGGVDFLHSVMGEFSDKATQSEIQELEGTMQSSSQSDTSLLQDLLNQVPSGLFGGKDEAGKVNELQANATAAQMQNTHISPRQPEAWTKQLDQIQKQIYPIIEWHDEMMQSITEAIEKIPVLPALIEQIEGIGRSLSSRIIIFKEFHRSSKPIRFLAACSFRTANHQPSQDRAQHWVI